MGILSKERLRLTTWLMVALFAVAYGLFNIRARISVNRMTGYKVAGDWVVWSEYGWPWAYWRHSKYVYGFNLAGGAGQGAPQIEPSDYWRVFSDRPPWRTALFNPLAAVSNFLFFLLLVFAVGYVTEDWLRRRQPAECAGGDSRGPPRFAVKLIAGTMVVGFMFAMLAAEPSLWWTPVDFAVWLSSGFLGFGVFCLLAVAFRAGSWVCDFAWRRRWQCVLWGAVGAVVLVTIAYNVRARGRATRNSPGYSYYVDAEFAIGWPWAYSEHSCSVPGDPYSPMGYIVEPGSRWPPNYRCLSSSLQPSFNAATFLLDVLALLALAFSTRYVLRPWIDERASRAAGRADSQRPIQFRLKDLLGLTVVVAVMFSIAKADPSLWSTRGDFVVWLLSAFIGLGVWCTLIVAVDVVRWFAAEEQV